MDIEGPGKQVYERAVQQLKVRAFRASEALRTAELYVNRGQRSGRRYRMPFTMGEGKTPSGRPRRKVVYYTASAPGEPPAVRTGVFRMSWWPRPRAEQQGKQTTVYPAIYTGVPYARHLQEGTKRMKPRPYAGPVKQMAWPAIRKIYTGRYTR